MDDQNELEPVPGDEDGDGEDQDAQCDVEEVDTFEPDEVNVKRSIAPWLLQRQLQLNQEQKNRRTKTKARGRLKRRAQKVLP